MKRAGYSMLFKAILKRKLKYTKILGFLFIVLNLLILISAAMATKGKNLDSEGIRGISLDLIPDKGNVILNISVSDVMKDVNLYKAISFGELKGLLEAIQIAPKCVAYMTVFGSMDLGLLEQKEEDYYSY